MVPGDLIIHTARQYRLKAGDVVTRTIAQVVAVHDDIDFVEALPLRRYCWVDGYFDMGRRLPLPTAEREVYEPVRVAIVGYNKDEVSLVFTS